MRNNMALSYAKSTEMNKQKLLMFSCEGNRVSYNLHHQKKNSKCCSRKVLVWCILSFIFYQRMYIFLLMLVHIINFWWLLSESNPKTKNKFSTQTKNKDNLNKDLEIFDESQGLQKVALPTVRNKKEYESPNMSNILKKNEKTQNHFDVNSIISPNLSFM